MTTADIITYPSTDGSTPSPSVVRAAGAVAAAVGLACWLGWLYWRVTTVTAAPLSIALLALELVAFCAGLVVTAGLLAAHPPWARTTGLDGQFRPLPLLLAEALVLDDLDDIVSECHGAPADTDGGLDEMKPVSDDTGEIAWAHRGIRVLGSQCSLRRHHRTTWTTAVSKNLRDAAWSIVALDGLRRLATVILLVAVLFGGAGPVVWPSLPWLAALVAGVVALSVGHWLLSGGHVRPAARLIWSMASVGAGLGDGVSRSGMPIRWATTMATLIVLNLAVALRGISDRWTHGLGPMDDSTRVVAMAAALATVAVGCLALRRLPQPELDHYGATRRLEECSVRHLTIGLTVAVAVVGFIAGLAPTPLGQ